MNDTTQKASPDPRLYRELHTHDGIRMPYYLLPFDKKGRVRSEGTQDALLADLKNGGYSHVVVFSHGWNTTWADANTDYDSFIQGMIQLRKDHQLPAPVNATQAYKPFLIGIFWPSIILAWGERGRGPDFDETDTAADSIEQALPVKKKRRFKYLVEKPNLTEAEAGDLAAMVAESERRADQAQIATSSSGQVSAVSFEDDDRETTGRELLDAWREFEDTDGQVGTLGGSRWNPLNILRLFSVYRMKERSNLIGHVGVSSLLADVRGSTAASIHLLGHSFGAKLLLSAVRAIKSNPDAPAPICSVLLLQAAVSHLSFASTVPVRGNPPGGYHDTHSRIERPVLATFSGQDDVLGVAYEIAMRRRKHITEPLPDVVRSAAMDRPSKYAALGHVGPHVSDEEIIDLTNPVTPLDLASDKRVVGLKGDGIITDHGAISNEAVWWTLYQQMRK